MRYICTILALLAIAACGGGAGPDVDWTAKGSGDPNVEPLQPLTVGSRTVGSNFGDIWSYDALIEHGGRQFVRVRVGRPTEMSDLNSVLMLRESDLGVELWYTSRDGWLPSPVLLVPATVRVGMRWRAKVRGKSRYEFEVTTRDLQRTAYGERPVWSIQETNLTTAAVIERRYIEGVGFTEVDSASQPSYASFMRPLDPRPTPPYPTLPATPLTPYIFEPGVFDGLQTTSVSLVRPADSSSATLIVKGITECAASNCDVDLCFAVEGASTTRESISGPVDTYHQGRRCSYQRFAENLPHFADDASGAFVNAHDVYWVPRDRRGGQDGVTAIFADPDSLEPRILAGSSGGANILSDLGWAAYSTTQGSGAQDPRPLGGQWAMLSNLVGKLALENTTNEDTQTTAFSLAAPGQTPQFAVLSRNKVLMYATLVDNTLPTPTPVATLSGQPSVTTDQYGQHLLITSPDGRIDRIVVADGTLVPEAIGRVELPAGEELVGALDLSGTLDGEGKLLLTTFTRSYEHLNERTDHEWTTRFYTTTMQPPVRWSFPPTAGVIAAEFGADVIVCWPPTSEEFNTEGWTIAGVSARQALPFGKACAQIVRDVVHDPALGGADLSKPDHSTLVEADALFADMRFDTEGPIPGVGRVSLGVAKITTNLYSLFSAPMGGNPFAALADGGYVSPAYRYTAGGLKEGVLIPPTTSGPRDRTIADRAGAGLWQTFYGGEVALIGRESQTFAPPPEATAHPQALLDAFASAGGGLVVRYATGSDPAWAASSTWFLLDAEGTWTTLPPPPSGSRGYLVRTASGVLCGSSIVGDWESYEPYCVDATGALVGSVASTQDTKDWVDLGDGTFLIGNLDGTVGMSRFDPAAQTVTPWDARDLAGDAQYDAAGRAYGALDDGTGERVVGRLAPDGFEPIDISEWRQRYFWVHVFYDKLDGIIPGVERLWVLSSGCQSGSCSTVASPIMWP